MVTALCARSIDDGWKQLLLKTGWTLRWIDHTRTTPADVTFPRASISLVLLAAADEDAIAREVRARASHSKKHVVFLSRAPVQSFLQRCVYEVDPDATAIALGDVAVLQALAQSPAVQQIGMRPVLNLPGSLADLAQQYEDGTLPDKIQGTLAQFF